MINPLAASLIGPPRISCQPITVNGLLEYSKGLLSVYLIDDLQPINKAVGGTAVKTIYQLGQERYLGKINPGTGLLEDDPNSLRSATKKDLGLAAIIEKISYDFYREFGKGLFDVPASYLSVQPIMDPFHVSDPMTLGFVSAGLESCIRVLSRFPACEGYQDFSKAKAKSISGPPISFLEYVHSYRRPPEMLLAPDGTEKPILGLMELLAVMRALADVDGLGGGAGNAGFVWVKDVHGQIIAARAVKIDPGCALSCKEEDKAQLINFVFNTKEYIGPPQRWLNDLRDHQTAKNDQRMTIAWDELSDRQQDLFLGALFNCLRYKNNLGVLDLLVNRQGKFKASKVEKLPKAIAQKLLGSLSQWLELQEEIYSLELRNFGIKYPNELLRAHYIDQLGELPLPMTDETFPVRELFTQIALISAQEQQQKEAILIESSGAHMLSSENDLKELTSPERSVAIHQLFENEGNKPVHKVLVQGIAGVGKSTLCQKIAHDWASDRLFKDLFKAVYWIPLRILNEAVKAGGVLDGIHEPNLLIATILGQLVMRDPSLIPSFLKELQTDRPHILLLLDGYDEASPLLQQVLAPLLSDPELHVLLTSRPNAVEALLPQVDCLAINLGFSDQDIDLYCHRFFHRNGNTLKSQQLLRDFRLALRSRYRLFQLAHIPLQLQMLCSLWEQGADKAALGNTLTELYCTLVDSTFAWGYRKKEVELSVEHKNRIYDLLGEIALKGLSQRKMMIPQQEVETDLQEANIDWVDLLNSGLLKSAGTAENRHFYFAHLTIQEYLIAKYMSRLPIEEQNALVDTYRFSPTFALVMIFLAGEIHRIDPSEDKQAVDRFFHHLCNEIKLFPAIIGSLSWELLPLRCLNECPDYNSPLSELEEALAEQPMVFIGDPAWPSKLAVTHWIAKEGLNRTYRWLVTQKGVGMIQECDSDGRSPLYFAAAGGDLDLVQWLCLQDASLIRKTTNQGANVFLIAALEGHLPIMDWLHQQDPSLALQTKIDGRNAMHNAAQNGHIEAMEWLYKLKPDLIQSTMTEGSTSMHIAAFGGKIASLEWLHKKDPSLIHRVTQKGGTPMSFAARGNHIAAMEWLHHCDPSLTDKLIQDWGMHQAAQFGKLAVIKWLHEKNPLFILKAYRGLIPIHTAAQYGQLEVMEWMHGQDNSLITKASESGQTAMHSAAIGGQVVVMQWLYEHDNSLLTKVDEEGDTSMHIAVQFGQLDAMKWLYERNNSLLTRVCKVGSTPLDRAVQYGQLDAMKWLHQMDSSLILQAEHDGTTPFHTAANYNQLDAMKWLYDQEPSLLLMTKNAGWTAMHTAAEMGHVEILKWLDGIDPTLILKKSKKGWNPMHSGAFNGHIAVLEWLYKRQPSLALQADEDGFLPHQIALQRGHEEAVNSLRQQIPMQKQKKTPAGKKAKDEHCYLS